MCFKKWNSILMPIIYVLAGILIGALLRGLFPMQSDIICSSLNLTYQIDDRNVKLEDGKCEQPVLPGEKETMLISVNYLPMRGELNDDGRDDAAVILMKRTKDGSLCQYVAAAVSKQGGAYGTNAVSIDGDSTVLDLAIEDGMIWITMEKGGSGEQMERQFVLRDGELIEIR